MRLARLPTLLPADSCYGHLCGLLFTPVQIVSSSFGSDLPGPLVVEPPFVLSLLPTGSAGKVQLESGPAATYVPPAASHSCLGVAAYVTGEKTRIAATRTAVELSASTNRFILTPLSWLRFEIRTGLPQGFRTGSSID